MLEEIACGRNRALLSLATGAGKTFIAVHLLKRVADAGKLRKALFVCDRDELRSQALTAFSNLYRDWCLAEGREAKAYFAFKCTAKSGGADHIADLRGSASSHFIACTVDLLSTGVDVPCVRNIVFLQYVRSPIVFHQMLGRGTRIDADTGKLMFRVFDYTDATSLLGAEFKTKFKGTGTKRPPGPLPEPPAVVEGCRSGSRPRGVGSLRW